MSLPVEDADELVRRRVDLDHITQMSFHMVVPDSITVGPSRTNFERLPQDDDRLPVRMEVPNRIRPGNDESMILINDTDIFNGNTFDDLSSIEPSQTSFNELPNTEISLPSHFPTASDDQFVQSPVQLPLAPKGRNLTFEIQQLQNRIHQIERRLEAADTRYRWIYPCMIGYFVLQLFLSFRRSTLN